MSEANEEKLIGELRERTEANSQRARFYLELAEWDLERALELYFSHEPEQPEEPKQRPKPDAKRPPANPSNFATVHSLHEQSSSDEEEGQAFYAGGSTRSGQQILGPGKNKNDIVSDMFRSVKERGGAIVHQHSDGAGPSMFAGTGYKLGMTPDDTTVVRDPEADRLKDVESDMVVVLRLWRNGFSLDSGELRPYEDPENAEFLQYVKRGEIPPELRSGPEVCLTMEDRRHEEFTKTSGPPKPFQGKGHLLGSPAPSIVGSTASQAVGTQEQKENQQVAQDALKVDENEPTTTIQFRLADGSRISGRFNHTHTIAHIREFITNAVPVYQLQTFILLTTFPNKELSDFKETIKDAGLLNALVVQRLK